MITIYKERMLTETHGWNVLDYNDKYSGREKALEILTNALEIQGEKLNKNKGLSPDALMGLPR